MSQLRAQKQSVIVTPSSWACLEMNVQNNVYIFKIDMLRRANCHDLAIVINKYWNQALFSSVRINADKVLDLISCISINTLSIKNLCQKHLIERANLKGIRSEENLASSKRAKLDQLFEN